MKIHVGLRMKQILVDPTVCAPTPTRMMTITPVNVLPDGMENTVTGVCYHCTNNLDCTMSSCKRF